ncbi:hypothetical protein C8R43DRAFT_674164 [Mycena crocata]|nr:hypothetical protein C8R43DRAFT_674164 [Mycena crocata]
MSDLPQELIEAILLEVNEAETLKACALAASSFRETCQRTLLHSLTLGDGDGARTCSAVCTRLSESPHTAGYITTLVLNFGGQKRPCSDVHDLQKVLGKLANVRRCTLKGGYCPWASMDPVLPALVDFLQRQDLDELHLLSFTALPRSMLAMLLSAASTLIFEYLHVSMDDDACEAPPEVARNTPPKINHLLLSHSDSVCELLALPEFASFVANLRTLRLNPHREHSGRIICAAARTLQHMSFNLTNSNGCTLSALPRGLAALRSVELRVQLRGRPSEYTKQLISSLAALLLSVPKRLEEIIVTCTTSPRFYDPPLLEPVKFAPLDDMIAESAAVLPRLCWRIANSGAEDRMAEFAQCMQLAFPRVHAQGMLVVERHFPDAGDWEQTRR